MSTCKKQWLKKGKISGVFATLKPQNSAFCQLENTGKSSEHVGAVYHDLGESPEEIYGLNKCW